MILTSLSALTASSLCSWYMECSPKPTVTGTGAIPQVDRLTLFIFAREVYARNVAQNRIALGLRKNTSSSSDECFEKGDNFFIWREKPKLWTGPYKLLLVEGKNLGKGGLQGFQTLLGEQSQKGLSLLTYPVNRSSEPPESRANTQQRSEAASKEMVDLIRTGTFKLMMLKELKQENVVRANFVLAVKHATDETMKHKAKLMLGGHRDKGNSSMVHTSSTVAHPSLRLKLALASAPGLELWMEDVRQVNLQFTATMKRDKVVKPKKLMLGRNKFPKLVLPLYRLSKSGDYWARTLSYHFKSHPKMEENLADPSLFYRHIESDLCATSGNYVNHSLRAALAKKREIKKIFCGQFECGEFVELPYEFLGCEL